MEISYNDDHGLNKAQQKAVGIKDGPVLVVAGAGTGKTRVIIERIRKLIEDGVPPHTILALTFTEKAAGEMLDRLSDESVGAALDTTIATYNGFGNDLLQAYGNEWGLGAFRLLGDTGQLVFLREHLDEFNLDYFAPVSNPLGQLDRLSSYVSLLKQQLVDPDTYIAYAEGLPATDEADKLDKRKQQEAAEFYKRYLSLCRENQVIDYDDQIYLTIQMLRERPNILRKLQEQYRYIMVDEFQDTNPMQSALVDLLAGKNQNVMVVGDDDQSIYGWRGATLANILDFTKRYPAAADVALIENYRSTQSILDAAYRLIQHNNPERLEVINKLDKRLHAQTNDGPAPVSRHFPTLDAELRWVAEDISKRIEAKQDPGSIAVLARRTEIVKKVHESLELHDVPHVMAGLHNDLYKQQAVRQLIEALKVISDPLDSMALFHVLSGPLFNLDMATLAQLASTANRHHENLADVLATSSEEACIEALERIATWRLSSSDLSVGDLSYAIITDSGWKQRIYEQAETDQNVFLQAQALSEYFNTLKEFERISDVPSVLNYLAGLPALEAGGRDFVDDSLDISDSLVNVLSIHRAKGLEWDVVYIVDCTEGSFPLRKHGGGMEIPDELQVTAKRADDHLSEERRLMYVAITRARNELIFTSAQRHGNGAPRRPSRFLSEALKDAPTEMAPASDQTSLELFSPRTNVKSVALPESMRSDGKLVLSVSKIVCWLDCPQEFYYKHVLGMPQAASPNSQYGTAIHHAIQSIFEGRKNGEIPDLETILEEVRIALPKAGYASAKSRDRAHTQALASAKVIYDRFMHEDIPIEIEKPFGVDIPDTSLKVIGRIDAVYEHENGVEIRDFKTSMSVLTAEQAKDRATASAQLTLYALAWQLLHDEMPAKLTLDFVETGQIGSVRKQAKSLQTMTTKLQEMVGMIQSGTYPPGKDHTYCSHPQ